ncbi:MAG: hypothetical protein Q9172_002648 [Xanthocarpia lactea]
MEPTSGLPGVLGGTLDLEGGYQLEPNARTHTHFIKPTNRGRTHGVLQDLSPRFLSQRRRNSPAIKMPLQSNSHPYVLAHRRDDARECRRLNTQHEVIKHAILGGQLVHSSIRRMGTIDTVADLGCGTGAWLEDVANTYFAEDGEFKDSLATLIGFDVNALAFSHSTSAGIQLVEHDCTKPFDARYIGRFDLVNIRGLAFEFPRARFPCLIENAVPLMRPGGYLQWLETKAQVWKAYPDSAEIAKVLDAINSERRERDLLPDLPQFMLRQLLASSPKDEHSSYHAQEAMTITDFNLLPGGIGSELGSQDTALAQRFSDTVLESMKLVLDSIVIRKMSQIPEESKDGEGDTKQYDSREIRELIDFIDLARNSDEDLAAAESSDFESQDRSVAFAAKPVVPCIYQRLLPTFSGIRVKSTRPTRFSSEPRPLSLQCLSAFRRA